MEGDASRSARRAVRHRERGLRRRARHRLRHRELAARQPPARVARRRRERRLDPDDRRGAGDRRARRRSDRRQASVLLGRARAPAGGDGRGGARVRAAALVVGAVGRARSRAARLGDHAAHSRRARAGGRDRRSPAPSSRRRCELDRTEIVLGAAPEGGTPILAHGDHIGALIVGRATPLDDGEQFLVTTVADELGASLQTAWLLAENRRRLEQQAALAARRPGRDERARPRERAEAPRRGGDEAARGGRRRLLPARPRARRAALRRRAWLRAGPRRVRVRA